MRTLILAGGFGTRLWPITLDRPKPLLPIAGKPLLDYIMELIPSEFLPAFVSVNQRFISAFEAWAVGKPVKLLVEKSAREEEKLGAVRALAWAVNNHSLWDDLLVIAGDNWLRLDLREFVAHAQGRPAVALFPLGDPTRVAKRYGVALVEGDRIRAFQEKPEKPCSDLVSTACYFFPRHVLPLLFEFVEAAPAGHDAPGYFLQWLLTRKEIAAFTKVEEWRDIGDRLSYIEANLHVTNGKSWVHPDAEVHDAVIECSVILGPARIFRAHLVECVVDEGAHIEGVELRGALVGKGAWLRS
ncbi:MAG: nucleotidyltransferase family protein [Candidatus Bipolaricaulota bacterium]|nr:nucleotidyltransferase family protein [Candidatus Bipolaricaulota bacterium]MDW8127310.1 nucleotidyltransferase family protein [Candidatus Bipolaricaulota bacterium]